ncbi:MAG: hypothetical protein ABIZ80_21255 [Bryobacteraceae bacterium]
MFVRIRILICLLGSIAALAQSRLTLDQLMSFVKSSVELKHADKQVAVYLSRVKLAEKLDDRTVEEMQGLGAGPKTVEALRVLAEASKNLAPPAPKVVRIVPAIPPPSAADQKELISRMREYAMSYSKNLPDFLCTQVTRRFADPSGMQFWQSLDTLTVRLTYFEQKESYKLVLVNNRVTDRPYESLGGATSTGEFGSMLREIFEPESQAQFKWERWATLRGRRAHVFSYRVAQANSRWRISYERTQEIVAGYTGLIYMDKATDMVLKITLDAEDIPPSFPVNQASTMLDYDYTKIGDRTFLLPLSAQVRMRQGKVLTKNDVEFRLYRKFSSDASITFDTPEPLSEDQIKEQPPK